MFIHTQSSTASTWIVPHQLNGKVIVEVLIHYAGSLHKVHPSKIVHVTDDTLIIEFTSNRTGVATILRT